MIIEIGFQSNCSELVTYLGLQTMDEVIAGLKTIVKVTGWRWRIELYNEASETVMIDIPTDTLGELLAIDNKWGLGASIEKLLSHLGDTLSDEDKTVLGRYTGVARLELWEHRFLAERVDMERWRYDPGEDTPETNISETPAHALFMAGFRKGRLFLVDQSYEPRRGDVLHIAIFTAESDATHAWLSEAGWKVFSDPSRAGTG